MMVTMITIIIISVIIIVVIFTLDLFLSGGLNIDADEEESAAIKKRKLTVSSDTTSTVTAAVSRATVQSRSGSLTPMKITLSKPSANSSGQKVYNMSILFISILK